MFSQSERKSRQAQWMRLHHLRRRRHAGAPLTPGEQCELAELEEHLKPGISQVVCSEQTLAKAEAMLETMHTHYADPGKPIKPWNIWRLARIKNWTSAEKMILHMLLGREVEIIVRDAQASEKKEEASI